MECDKILSKEEIEKRYKMALNEGRCSDVLYYYKLLNELNNNNQNQEKNISK